MIANAPALAAQNGAPEKFEIADTRGILPLNGGSAEVFASATDIASDLWAAAFGESPKDFEYYRLIEDTMTSHFSYLYLLLYDAQGIAIALQPVLIADQDLTAASGAALSHIVRLLRRIFPRTLQTRMLMAGCLVGDAMIGLLPGADLCQASALLAEALPRLAKRERISLITVKDFPAEFREQLQPLTDAGYCRMPSFPPVKLDLNFTTFEEYLTHRLSKITRKGLRRKLRRSAGVPLQMEVTSDCREVIDEIYPLYLEVARRSEISFETFTREYYLEASRRLPERFRFFIWRQGGKAVAFSFCTIWRGAIYDNDIGLDYAVAHELNLYYVTFRDLLEWSLAQRLTTYYSAPFNYDPKLHLRMEAVPMDIYVRHTSGLLNAALRRIAPIFAPAKSDAALRRHLRI